MKTPFRRMMMPRKTGREQQVSRSERKKQIRKHRANRIKAAIKGWLPKPWRGAKEYEADPRFRQQRRRRAFIIAFNKVTEQYGGEPRKFRRRIARNISKQKETIST